MISVLNKPGEILFELEPIGMWTYSLYSIKETIMLGDNRVHFFKNLGSVIFVLISSQSKEFEALNSLL